MKFVAAILFLLPLGAYPNLEKAPNSFSTPKGKAVFVDFKEARYTLKYDVKKRKAFATTQIRFEQNEEGRPLFDLVSEPQSVTINGELSGSEPISAPDDQTSYRSVSKTLNPGEHVLTITSAIEKNIKFENNGVSNGFWMSDLTDRKYMEQYLPANLEYDQYPMSFSVEILNTADEHEVFTNGAARVLGKNRFEIDFPSYFTTSSVYFHLSPKGRFYRKEFSFASMSGEVVPVLVYSKSSWNLNNIQEKILGHLGALEARFGPWGHPGLTVYIAGMGGMEHSGATITSLYALGHELAHSYFARGVMPVDGNSGWIDEAIASWGDDGYDSRGRPYYRSAKMSGFSQYKRITDRKAYSEGASFMEYLNHRLAELGGLSAFLSKLYSNYLHKNLTTEIFQKELESFSAIDLSSDFSIFVYGEAKETKGAKQNTEGAVKEERFHLFHPKLNKKDLLELL